MEANYTRITLEERIEISKWLSQKLSTSQIAKRLGRERSSVKRELDYWRGREYDPIKAQWYAQRCSQMRKRGKRKLKQEGRLWDYVEEKLKLRWSPEQISQRLKADFPTERTMQISHESIYTYIYLLPKGALKKELIGCLRREKKKRKSRKGIKGKRSSIKDMISIEERPAEVASRSVAGHWEGDLIVGNNHKSALGTVVERKTRSLILVPLKAVDASSVRQSFEQELASLPEQMRQSMAYDRGTEMAEHKLFTANSQVKVYFCHPHSPWERGSNENTNGLVRQYFPKGTDFREISVEEIKRVQHQMNERPRKVLGWKTPKEVFEQEVLSISGSP
jgi:IS30 family transposase